MKRLELTIPPDVVWVAVAGLMWLVSALSPRVAVPSWIRTAVVVALTVAGVALIVAARSALSDADTTWRPAVPGRTTSLVTSGVFRFSRNPIYLGMFLVLVGLGFGLASPGAIITSLLFVAYVDRFQIVLEERALAETFGSEYSDYRHRVRRWV